MGEGTQIGYEFMQNPGHINFQKSDNCTNKSRDIQIFNMQNCPSGSGHLWQNSINCTEKKADKFASRILSKPCPWDQKLRSWFARNECVASVSEFFFEINIRLSQLDPETGYFTTAYGPILGVSLRDSYPACPECSQNEGFREWRRCNLFCNIVLKKHVNQERPMNMRVNACIFRYVQSCTSQDTYIVKQY